MKFLNQFNGKEKQNINEVRKWIEQIPGVSGTALTHSYITGISKPGYQIVVYLKYYDEQIINQIPSSIDGIPVVFKVIGEVTIQNLKAPLKEVKITSMQTPTSRFRPIKPGTSIGNQKITDTGYTDAGTLGGFPTLPNGEHIILSNNHVIAHNLPGESLGSIGDSIVQPGTLDGGKSPADTIGQLSKWITIAPSGSNRVDCAYATINSGITLDANTLCNYRINSTIIPRIGMEIKKAGRTTGCTYGFIESIDVSTNVDYGTGKALFTGQVITSNNFLSTGDSGSVVVTNDGYNNAVGLLFAGTGNNQGVFNLMTEVEQSLGISFQSYCVSPTIATTIK